MGKHTRFVKTNYLSNHRITLSKNLLGIDSLGGFLIFILNCLFLY